jgi:hypothetical protein
MVWNKKGVCSKFEALCLVKKEEKTMFWGVRNENN